MRSSFPSPMASFDGVISTFGVMFAQRSASARRAEMARVCRLGRAAGAGDMDAGRGRCGVLRPSSAVTAMRRLRRQSPLAWGDPAHVEALLGEAFELTFEQGVNNAYHGSADDIWAWYVRGFGPLRLLVDSLDADRREALQAGCRYLSSALCGAGRVCACNARLSDHHWAAALNAAGRGAISAPRSRRQSDNRCPRRRSKARR